MTPRPYAGTLVALAALLALSACTDEAPEPETAPTPKPTASPTTTLDALDWQSPAVAGARSLRIEPTDTGWVGVEAKAVTGLTTDGTRTWRVEADGPDTRVVVADGVPVVANGSRVTALDPATGDTLWTTRGRTTGLLAHGGVVVVPTGTDSLTAYDARTGEPRWTLADDVDATDVLVSPRDGATGLVADADGTRATTVDLETGEALGSFDVTGTPALVGDVVVDDAYPAGRLPKGPCPQRVVGHELDGSVRWQRVLELDATSTGACDLYALQPSPDGYPSLSRGDGSLLLDPASGETVWHGTQLVWAVQDGVVVAGGVDQDGGYGFDLATGAQRWHYPHPTGPWTAADGYAAASTDCPDGSGLCSTVVDLATGEPLLDVPGSPGGWTDGGLQTNVPTGGDTETTFGHVTLPALKS
jgi:outer membrane protein assembly factor BamB